MTQNQTRSALRMARAVAVTARSPESADYHKPTSADAARFISSLEEREAQLIAKEAEQKQKLRIANIASQQLHVYSPAQMTAFCAKYWEIFRVLADAAEVTAVRPEGQEMKPAKKSRLGPVATVVAAHVEHEAHKNGK